MDNGQVVEAIKVLEASILALSERLAKVEEALARQNQVLNIVPLQNVVTGVGGEWVYV